MIDDKHAVAASVGDGPRRHTPQGEVPAHYGREAVHPAIRHKCGRGDAVRLAGVVAMRENREFGINDNRCSKIPLIQPHYPSSQVDFKAILAVDRKPNA